MVAAPLCPSTVAPAAGGVSLTPSVGKRTLERVTTPRTFWTNARRWLIAKTLANSFLLLIGASATGEVIVGLPVWLKTLVGAAIAASGVLAVIVMPEGPEEGE